MVNPSTPSLDRYAWRLKNKKAMINSCISMLQTEETEFVTISKAYPYEFARMRGWNSGTSYRHMFSITVAKRPGTTDTKEIDTTIKIYRDVPSYISYGGERSGVGFDRLLSIYIERREEEFSDGYVDYLIMEGETWADPIAEVVFRERWDKDKEEQEQLDLEADALKQELTKESAIDTEINRINEYLHGTIPTPDLGEMLRRATLRPAPRIDVQARPARDYYMTAAEFFGREAPPPNNTPIPGTRQARNQARQRGNIPQRTGPDPSLLARFQQPIGGRR